ncbi:MAG TPA: hypothetical protein VFP97_16325 [Chitinophagaceae bacterium]|nr:hypothetical protein [Chitinophagaceae bacterium]
MKTMLILLLLLSLFSDAQMSKRDSLWLTLKPFVGEWKGEGGGKPGQGIYERSYQFILNNRFIEIRNKSTYPPTDKNPKGEVHEDIGYFSYDNAKKTFMLRQFHIEGFVNEFRLESIWPDKKTLVFMTESIENIPAGYRAKETYRLIGDDEIEETFEIAEPDKDFKVYSKVKLVRQK